MKKTAIALMTLAGILASPFVLAGDLSGFWQHEELPAWIELRFEDGVGTGTVVRNDEYPDRVGRILLKDVAGEGGDGEGWRGQVFAERLQEYRDAEISLPEPDLMRIKVKVGFISRTVEWSRVEVVPGP